MTHASLPLPEKPKTSAQAVWSLILGILSIFCLWIVGSIPAILLGVAALRKIDRSGGTLQGRGLSIAGIVTGGVGVLAGISTIAILASVALPVFNSAQANAKLTAETMRIQNVFNACSIYAADNDGRFPDTLAAVAKNGTTEATSFVSILEPKASFLYRPGLTFDSDPKEVILASPASLRGKRAVGYLNGAVELITEQQFQDEHARLFP